MATSPDRRRRRSRRRLSLSLLTLALLPGADSALLAETRERRLVSTEQLGAMRGEANLRIVDLRIKVTEYWKGHIPGAVYLHWQALRLPARGVPLNLTRPSILAAILGELGISPATRVVAYGETSAPQAAYLAWALDCLGHPRAMVLDGGFEKWAREERPVTQKYPEISPTEYPLPSALKKDVRATIDDVREALSQEDTVVLDARPSSKFSGKVSFWERGGHVEGAVNRCNTADLTEEGTWRPVDELREAYGQLGVTPDKDVIVMCGQGRRSAQTYFTLKHVLQFPRVRNYEASFQEWATFTELPVSTGAD